MKATDRHRARVAELLEAPFEFDNGQYPNEIMETVEGEVSDNLMKFGPLVSNAAFEAAAQIAKSKEDDAKAEAAKNSPAGKAKAEAEVARKNAAMAAAEAIAEADPKGQKHKDAAQAELVARVAEAKAAYFAQPGATAANAPNFGPAKGGKPEESFFEKYKWPLIGGGGALAVGVVAIVLMRKKRR